MWGFIYYNRIYISLIFLFPLFLLECRNIIEFCLNFVTLLNSLFSSSHCFVDSLRFWMQTIMASTNKQVLLLPFQFSCLLIALPLWLYPLVKFWIEAARADIFFFFLILEGKFLAFDHVVYRIFVLFCLVFL